MAKNNPGPLHKSAVALRYDGDKDAAPQVVASGKGLVAEKLVELARAHEVPVHEDKALSAALGVIEVGQHIPPEMYRAVAEVLAFVYRLHGKSRNESKIKSEK